MTTADPTATYNVVWERGQCQKLTRTTISLVSSAVFFHLGLFQIKQADVSPQMSHSISTVSAYKTGMIILPEVLAQNHHICTASSATC